MTSGAAWLGRLIALSALGLGACAAQGGREPIASRGSTLAEDLDVATAAAAPMTTTMRVAPLLSVGATPEAPAREQMEDGALDAAAQRSRFQAELAERLARIDERLAALALAPSVDTERLRRLRRARTALESDRTAISSLPDADAQASMARAQARAVALEQALDELQTPAAR